MLDYSSFKKDLAKLVSFNTVKSSPSENAPFGSACADALDFILALAKDMGFETINYDNYAGEVICGEGQEIGMISHIDIVPVGSGWDTDPLTLTEKDGRLYGRGVEDNKGPTLLTLYALKQLMDSKVALNKKFRFFIGCNEETDWKDIEYLSKKTTLPEYGFSPDGNFPVTYAEKGVFPLAVKLPKLKRFTELVGGTALNAVCDYAYAVADAESMDKNLIDKYQLTLDGNKVQAFGVSAHGSDPTKGKNALKALLSFLAESGEEQFLKIVSVLFEDSLDIFSAKTEQGLLTISPNLIKKQGKDYYLYCDVRVPAPLDFSEILKKVKEALGDNLVSAEEKHPPVMLEKNGWFISALLCAYKEVTGDDTAVPLAMSGSTFARAFSKGCSFGPFRKNMSGNIHGANEWVEINWIKKSYEIYYKALINLNKI